MVDKLDTNEKQIILSALYTVVKTGGGSPEFTLYRHLSQAWKMDMDINAVRSYSQTVIDEWKESCGESNG